MVMQLAGLGRRVCWLHTGALHARSTPSSKDAALTNMLLIRRCLILRP